MNAPQLKNKIIKTNGNTEDIVKAVLKADSISKEQTREISKQFKPTPAGLREIWEFVKYNFRYKEDPRGVQWIKSPERLFYEREGDCKSFTIFVNSILKNLNVKHVTRFISQNEDPDPTHVYTVAMLNGKKYIIDTVYHSFNAEPNYKYKYDYKNNNTDMTKISYLSGTIFAEELEKVKKFNFAEATEAERQEILLKEMFLIDALQKQGAEAEAAAQMFTTYEMDEREKEAINTAAQQEAEAIKGIGVIRIIAAARKKILNTLLRVTLPRTGLVFLYTQVNDKYLSDKAKAKKRRQDKFKNIILQAAGITSGTFDMMITNAVKSKTGKTPLQFVKSMYPQNATPAGPLRQGATPAPPPSRPQVVTRKMPAVGFPVALVTQAAGYVVGLVQNITQIVKGMKKEDEIKAADAPSPADFDGFRDPDTPAAPMATQTIETTQTMQTPPAMLDTKAGTETEGAGAGAGTEDQSGNNKKLLLIGAAAAIGIYFIMQIKKK